MRVRKRADSGIVEGDLTPMIDMTFQLIAFFMVLINFTQSEQVDAVELPKSELAKPAEGQLEHPIMLHLLVDGDTVVYGGQRVPVDKLGVYLTKEKNNIQLKNIPVSKATVIIRAHRAAQTGKVQKLIRKCQDAGFETFALRAEEKLIR